MFWRYWEFCSGPQAILFRTFLDWLFALQKQSFPSFIDFLDSCNFCIWFVDPLYTPCLLGFSFLISIKIITYQKKKKKFGTYQELSNNLQELWAAAAATSLENPYCWVNDASRSMGTDWERLQLNLKWRWNSSQDKQKKTWSLTNNEDIGG